LLNGAQQLDAQSEFFVQFAAQLPPLVVTQLSFAQQSSELVQEPPAATHVLPQKPRGAQTVTPVLFSSVQHPETQSAPVVQGAAQNACSPVAAGTKQLPEQQAFGVLVQLAPVPRHADASVDDSGTPASALAAGASGLAVLLSTTCATTSAGLASGAVASGTEVDASDPASAIVASALEVDESSPSAPPSAELDATSAPASAIGAAPWRVIVTSYVLAHDAPLPIAVTVSSPEAEEPSEANVTDVVAVNETPSVVHVQSFSWLVQPL
jgi:hypothetical protein